MSTKVKICGITSVADAAAAVEAGADAIGLMFYSKSPRHIPLATAKAISRELPPFVLRVGVFVNPSVEEVQEAIAAAELNLLQFHGEETPQFCLQFGVMTMKAFRVRDEDSLRALPDYATDAWLLDAYSPGALGGTGERRPCEGVWQTDLPRGRADAAERGRGRAPRAAVRRGCVERRRKRAGPEGRGEDARVRGGRAFGGLERVTKNCGRSMCPGRNRECVLPHPDPLPLGEGEFVGNPS
jgi:phosphoribosylanthranilate isomerase